MLFLASILLGIVPMLVYAFVVWRVDRWEKEPIPLIITAFVWGSVPSIFFALIAQIILGIPVSNLDGEATLTGQLYQSSIIAPVTEELIKAFGLALIFVIFRKEIDSILDGLIYGSLIGFGFSAVENILYFLGQPDPASLLGLFFLRAFVFGMLHALFTGLAGVGFAMGMFAEKRILKIVWPIAGILAAIATHSLHNYFATMGGIHILYAVGGVSLGVIWFVVTAVICLVHENKWIRYHLADEVSDGVLYSRQALDAAGFWTRSSLSIFDHGFSIVRKRRKLLQRATDLAYQKQRMLKFGDSAVDEDRLVRLRNEIRELSREDPFILNGTIERDTILPPPLPPTRKTPPKLPSQRR